MAKAISLRHLRCFTAVAETGSFTLAAEMIAQSQSSLTSTIQQLEKTVGLKLFDRTTRRVELTRDAIWFKVVAEHILRDFDSAIDDLKAAANSQTGRIAVAAAPSMMIHVLTPTLAVFRKAFPNIHVSVNVAGSDQVERDVLCGRVDFGISGRLSDVSDLAYSPILSDPFGVICPRRHPILKRRRTLTWKDLAPYDYVTLAADTSIGATLDKHAELALRNRANFAFQAASTSALYALLSLGETCSILPALAARTEPLSSFKFRILEKPTLTRDICLITRRSRSLSPTVCRILEVLMLTIQNVQLYEAKRYTGAVAALLKSTSRSRALG